MKINQCCGQDPHIKVDNDQIMFMCPVCFYTICAPHFQLDAEYIDRAKRIWNDGIRKEKPMDKQKLLDRIESLEKELAATKAALNKPEIDWSKKVGCLVEVREGASHKWTLGVLKAVRDLFQIEGRCQWFQEARLYHGTHVLNMIKHGGSSACPIHSDSVVVVELGHNARGVGKAHIWDWACVKEYCVIDPRSEC